MSLTPWSLHRSVVVHAEERSIYTGPSVYGFSILADDVMICAKPKAAAPFWAFLLPLHNSRV